MDPLLTHPSTSPLAAPRSEGDLLLLIAGGDRDAFTAFYDRTNSRVFGLVKRVLIDPAQSEEVTQDIFLEVWQNATRFDPARGNAVSWLLTMTHRRAIDRVRASQASRTRDMTVGIRDYQNAHDDATSTVEVQLEHQRVTALMQHLTHHQQQALELTYFQGLTNAEAALKAGIPVGTMKTRLRDSLIALRRHLPNAA